MSERRRALITGASVRLGRAMALDLAEQGWDVAIHYRKSRETAEETADACRANGAKAVTVQADLEDEAETAALVAQAADSLHGPLDTLINNASRFENDTIETMTLDSWQKGMGSNLRAPVKLSQDFAAQAPRAETDAKGEARARAVIVNLIDQRIHNPTPMFMSYITAKSALMAFTRISAKALAPHVRVGAIGPGPTIAAAGQSQQHFAKQRNACLLGRGSDPEDIVHAMRFIIHNKAFTGQMLTIDGGQHLLWQTPDIIGDGL